MLKANKFFIALFVLVVMYASLLASIVAFGTDAVKYLPPILLLSCFVVGFFHPQLDGRFAAYAALVFASSFLLECIGANTGAIFGQFLYGNNLGVTLFDTPLIIGIIWLLLSYTAAVVVSQIAAKSSVLNTEWAKSFLAALLMVSVNFLMEQPAAACDWWYWKYQATPIQNYTAWFTFSFAFNFLFLKLEIDTNNKMALWFMGIIWFFFLGLAIVPAFWMGALS